MKKNMETCKNLLNQKKQPNQFYTIFIYLFFTSILLHCKIPTLNGTCDPKSKGFQLSILVKASQQDPSYACTVLSLPSIDNAFEIKYENHFYALKQNETVNQIQINSTKSISKCEIFPNLPAGLNFDPLTCAVSGSPSSGQITKKYSVTAYHLDKTAKTDLNLKVLYIPKFAYVGNYTANTIGVYSINQASGALTNLFTRPSGGGPNSFSISPDNRFLAVANRNSQDVRVYSINQLTGDINLEFTETVGLMESIGVVYHPSGNYLYARTNLGIRIFSVNQTTGAITTIDSFAVNGGASSIAIDPFGRFLYVPLYNNASVAIFKINVSTGLLTASNPASVSAGVNPRAMDVSGNGNIVYVLNESGQSVTSYELDSVNETLKTTEPATAATGVFPLSIHQDPMGRYVYVANEDSISISLLKINQLNGSLTSQQQIPMAVNPTGITVDTSGKFVYTTNFANNDISVFTMSQTTGALTAGPQVGSGIGPTVITTIGTNP